MAAVGAGAQGPRSGLRPRGSRDLRASRDTDRGPNLLDRSPFLPRIRGFELLSVDGGRVGRENFPVGKMENSLRFEICGKRWVVSVGNCDVGNFDGSSHVRIFFAVLFMMD